MVEVSKGFNAFLLRDAQTLLRALNSSISLLPAVRDSLIELREIALKLSNLTGHSRGIEPDSDHQRIGVVK